MSASAAADDSMEVDVPSATSSVTGSTTSISAKASSTSQQQQQQSAPASATGDATAAGHRNSGSMVEYDDDATESDTDVPTMHMPGTHILLKYDIYNIHIVVLAPVDAY
jgi:hypothetical protein